LAAQSVFCHRTGGGWSGFIEETLHAGDAMIIIGRVQSLPPSLREKVGRQQML
jgi:hypothetical protein